MTKLKATVASNGKAALLMGIFNDGEIYLSRFSPKALGLPERAEEMEILIVKALLKMGVERDVRCKYGYRKISARQGR